MLDTQKAEGTVAVSKGMFSDVGELFSSTGSAISVIGLGFLFSFTSVNGLG